MLTVAPPTFTVKLAAGPVAGNVEEIAAIAVLSTANFTSVLAVADKPGTAPFIMAAIDLAV
ncbi:hypothetical protein D3C81_1495900 [compost metagenome]